MVLQVHDELIVYAAGDEVDMVKEILRESMEGAAGLSVPLVVNIAAGKTWLEAK
jgi:DNA polymerase-1